MTLIKAHFNNYATLHNQMFIFNTSQIIEEGIIVNLIFY